VIFKSLIFIFFLSLNLNSKKIDLNYAINTMLKNSGEYKASKKGLDYAMAKVDEARAGWYPKGNITYYVAPMFEETGDALNSVKDYGSWGIYSRIEGNIIQPLHTFGVISSYKKVANIGYDVELEKVKMKKEELIERTKKLYYSVQLSYDLVDVLLDANEKIQKAVKIAKDKVTKNKLPKKDLHSLKFNKSKIEIKASDAKRAKKMAEKGLLVSLGLDLDSSLDFKKAYINQENFKLKEEKHYLKLARENRPELKMIDHGIKASLSLWKAEKNKKLPFVFLGAFGGYSYSNVREDQKSAFANDPYNNLRGGLALGIRMNLDWGTMNAKARQNKHIYEKILFSKNSAEDGVILEVKKAYMEVKDYEHQVKTTEEGMKNANSWFLKEMMGYSMGLAETKDLIKSMEASFESKLNYYLSIYKYNLAIAKLSKVVGVELLKNIKY
jgi:outer membrane protein